MRKLLLSALILYLAFNATSTVYETGTIQPFFCDKTDCNSVLEEIISKNKSTCVFYDISRAFAKRLQDDTKLYIYEENHKSTGIPMRNEDGLMHHKYCTIEPNRVVTGSYNPTAKNHHDNLLLIESKTLKQNYEKETKRMLQKTDPEYEKEIIHNGNEIEQYFCSVHDCKQEVIEEINKAKKHILFLTFTFTAEEVADAIEKKSNDVTVAGYIESFQNHDEWVYPRLQHLNVTVYDEEKLQHNKLFIIDNTTITGSYNPTWSANNINDENLLILENPSVTMAYKKYLSKTFNLTA